MTDTFDYIAIGGGSGGLATAQRAAQYGAKVAVIESARLGGTCVNVGCIPKKVMWNAAGIADAMGGAHDYGFSLASHGHDWSRLKSARDAYIARLNGIYETNLSKKHITWLRGVARFIDPRTIDIDGRRVTAPHITLATGGKPSVPTIEGAELGITSDGYFDLKNRPKRVAIIGSGYIAVELASSFVALGSAVTLLIRKDRVLRTFDEMISKALMRELSADGIQLISAAVPRALKKFSETHFEVVLADDRSVGPFDCVLWAIGREPMLDGLNIAAAGIATDSAGFIKTDAFQNTNVSGIYAIGDITGRAPLTPVAIAAGRRLADRLFNKQIDRHLSYELIPSVVFSHPPIGTVGMTELEARERYGDAVTVFKSDFVPMYYALATKKRRTEMKLICIGPEQRIVGLHVIGQGADEMLQGFAVAIKMGATKKDFDDTVAIHPTAAEEFVTMR
jgi:glutathione reductase (NADPH)